HNPLTPHWVGSWPSPGVGSGFAVNAITVQGDYAYLGTDDPAHELVVLNISNPNSPTVPVGAPYHPGGLNGGKSVYTVGDTLYFGKNYAGASANEFFVLDASNSAVAMPAPVSPQNIGSSAVGIVVRDFLAFVLTSTGNALKIFD